MKKFLAAIFSMTMLVSPVLAQNTPIYLTSATTVSANTGYGNNYFYVALTSNVTTFQFTVPSGAVQNPEAVFVVFAQDATGSRTVGYATNIKGSPTVNSTASSYTMIEFVYDSVSQNWYGIVVAHS